MCVCVRVCVLRSASSGDSDSVWLLLSCVCACVCVCVCVWAQIRVFGRLRSLRNIIGAVATAVPPVTNALLFLFIVIALCAWLGK